MERPGQPHHVPVALAIAAALLMAPAALAAGKDDAAAGAPAPAPTDAAGRAPIKISPYAKASRAHAGAPREHRPRLMPSVRGAQKAR